VNTLADLLDGIAAFYERYIVFQSRAQVTAITLWVAHTHALEAFDVTPYVAITSPEIALR
jgi:hypothetical protein